MVGMVWRRRQAWRNFVKILSGLIEAAKAAAGRKSNVSKRGGRQHVWREGRKKEGKEEKPVA